jgi:peroxiredoxin
MMLKPLTPKPKLKQWETIPETKFIYRMLGEDMQFYDSDDSDGNHDIRWVEKSVQDLFANKRVLILSSPGVFTNVSSNWQLPSFEGYYEEIKGYGVDEVYVISVDDSFAMRAWLKTIGINKIKYLPDGNGDFTRRMGMLVDKSIWGSGFCSWRYAMIVENGLIRSFIPEEGIDVVEKFGNDEDGWKHDPYSATTPDKIIEVLKGL